MADIAKATVIQKARDFGWTYNYMARIAGVAPSTIRGWQSRGTGIRQPLDLLERRLKLEMTGKAPVGGKSDKFLVPGAQALIEEAMEAGLDWEKLAAIVGTHISTLHRWKRGDAGTREGMEKIREHLDKLKAAEKVWKGWKGEDMSKPNGSSGKFADGRLLQNMDLSSVQPTDTKTPAKAQPNNEVCHYIVRVRETTILITDPNLRVAVSAAIKKLEGTRDVTAERAVELVDRMEYDALGYETSTLDSWRPVNSRVNVVTTWSLADVPE